MTLVDNQRNIWRPKSRSGVYTEPLSFGIARSGRCSIAQKEAYLKEMLTESNAKSQARRTVDALPLVRLGHEDSTQLIIDRLAELLPEGSEDRTTLLQAWDEKKEHFDACLRSHPLASRVELG